MADYEFEVALEKLSMAVAELDRRVTAAEKKTNQAIRTMKYKAAQNFSKHQQWLDKEGRKRNDNPRDSFKRIQKEHEAKEKGAADKGEEQAS